MYTSLYTVYCILYTVYCILYTSLYTVYEPVYCIRVSSYDLFGILWEPNISIKMMKKYTSLFIVYESPLVVISIRSSAYTSLRLYESPLHRYFPPPTPILSHNFDTYLGTSNTHLNGQ